MSNIPEMQNQHSASRKCLLVIGRPMKQPDCFQYRAIGFFPSKTAAKKRLEAILSDKPDSLYLLLTHKTNPMFARFAAQLAPEPREPLGDTPRALAAAFR